MATLANNEKVRFLPEPHIYLMGDRQLMGVTTLMKKHGIGPDYSGISEATLNAKAKKGTACHELLEAYDNFENVEETAYLQEYSKLGLAVLRSEYLVSDNEIVASSIDKVIATDEDDVFDLADVKTTSKLHKDAVSWQLSIYAYLFELQNKGLKVRNLYAIHVDLKAGTCNLISIDRKPVSEVKRLLKCEKEGEIFTAKRTRKSKNAITVNTKALAIDYGKLYKLKASLKLMEDKVKQAEQELLAQMIDNHIDELALSTGTVKVKAAYTRETVDTKRLKEEYPDIAATLTKETYIKESLIFTPKK